MRSKLHVVNLEILTMATNLTSPAVSSEDLLTKLPVSRWL